MTKRSAADSGEAKNDEEESYQYSTVPMFTPVVAPKITSISHEALVKWKKLRKEYEAKMRARCRTSGEDFAAVTQSVKESFDVDLLDTFCTLRLDQDMETVTEEALVAEIDTIMGKVKNDHLPDIKALFKRELKMNLRESDVDARVLSYFQRFRVVMRENGLEDCFSGADGEREKCKRLVCSLAPPSLKDEVKTTLRWKNKEAGTSVKKLYHVVNEKAKDQERHFQQSKRLKTAPTQKEARDAKVKDRKGATKSSDRTGQDDKRESKSSASSKVERNTKEKKQAGPQPARLPPSPCPKCKQMHWLNDCPSATDTEKVELREKLRKASKAKKSSLKRLGELLPQASRVVTINGVLELPCCPDTGSQYTVMSQKHWDKLLTADPTVTLEPLPEPIYSKTFGEHVVVAKARALLHIMIHTAAGPVEPVELVPCLIVDMDDDEFIIGKEVLVSLGIDVDRQLEQLATRSDDSMSGDPFELEADESPVSANASTDEDIRAAVDVLIDRALEHGFPAEKVEQLRTIVHMYDVWRLELRDDPPARVSPLEVRLKDGANPVKCKPRKYPPHIRQFLRDFNAKLVELGLVYENPTSRWASPVLPVKKSAELMDLRQTTDYRAVNALTDSMAAVMPILSLVMENARGKQHFGLFDFLKGFWQLPLAEFCQEWLSYMTDEKIFTPRRVPQGSSDAAIHFQQTMEKCFSSLLYEHLLIWIDDLLLFADDIDTYLEKLAEFFALLDQFGLKLSVKKSSLYQQEVKWCGKLISADGVRHDPSRIDSLRSMPYPTTAGELQQFICAVNWMRESLVDYARHVSPLQRKLDDALASTRRTKRAAAGITISLDTEERLAFDHVKEMLASSATLDFPDDQATTCLFTDASDAGWALIITQVKDYSVKVPVTEQQHRLIQCMSGTFTGSQLNWTVTEKEAFPITMACDKLDYLLLRPQGFRLFCDHRNLIHIFAPDENVKKHVRGKLLRWSIKLMNYKYIIQHIAGPQNLWADMISRWAGNHAPAASIKRLRADPSPISPNEEPQVSALRPLDSDGFVWPTCEEILAEQLKHEQPSAATLTDSGVYAVNSRIWIPSHSTGLIQRLFIICHCGAQGHRGHAAMVEHLKRIFVIDHLSDLAAQFVRQCRLCLHTKGGRIIPRPWSETIECTTRNGVLHFDFLYMGQSFGDSRYLLVLKDHASHYCELVVADTADSTVTVDALLAWHSRFGLPPLWVSDNGAHFKNEVMSELARRLRTRQQFTPAYCPWINGSIERVNRDILQVMRALILEYKINSRDWVYLVPMVQSSLNHTAVPSLGNRAPVELFTGLPCPSPLREFYLPGTAEFQEVPTSENVDAFLDQLRGSLQDMHKVVNDQRLKQRLLNKKRQRGESLANFAEGDYVIRSRVDDKNGNKLLVTWIGPYRVTRADSHSFRIQHLITGTELDVHASRLKFYADSSLNVTEELREHIAAQGIVLAVEKLISHRWNQDIGEYEVLVQWKGLEEIENSYEPLSSLSKDVATLVQLYIDSADQELQEYWQRFMSTGERVPPQMISSPSVLEQGSQQAVPPPSTTVVTRSVKGKGRRSTKRSTTVKPAVVKDPEGTAEGDTERPKKQSDDQPDPEHQSRLAVQKVLPSAVSGQYRRTRAPRRLASSVDVQVQVADAVSRRTRSHTTRTSSQAK